jgi:hypothetical protein
VRYSQPFGYQIDSTYQNEKLGVSPNLERFNHGHLAELQSPEQQAKFLMLLTSFRLQDLASDGGRAIAVAWERDRIARI